MLYVCFAFKFSIYYFNVLGVVLDVLGFVLDVLSFVSTIYFFCGFRDGVYLQ